MIITKKVHVKIINHNIIHYKDKGYKVKYGDIIEINVNDLSNGSHILIDVKCNECNIIKKIKYQDYYKIIKNHKYYSCISCKDKQKKYYLDKFGVDNVSKLENVKNKKIMKSIKRYGVKNVFQSEEIKEKSKLTCFKKYGVEYASQSKKTLEKSKNTRINKNLQIPDEKLNDLQKYYLEIKKLTRKNKKILFNNWNGFDYYDNEFIIDNFNLESNNKNYPTIDHKISIFYGFNNNIKIEEISSLENLCITKRKNNSSKGKKNENIYRINKII